ncbi:hypothetical protein PRUPE_8G115400 [Prunus persica]|uniref:Uncharacterized protein n=1 Tax=Prunus persica TaxID=3760 RepID=A0A251MYQ1_PRUPE|nr:hypothetical protein PRUPE_8G115400 [Prunus persica]
MVIQRLEMCLELLKLALEFVLLVAQAVEIALQHNMSPFTSYSAYSSVPVHFVGFLP